MRIQLVRLSYFFDKRQVADADFVLTIRISDMIEDLIGDIRDRSDLSNVSYHVLEHIGDPNPQHKISIDNELLIKKIRKPTGYV
jgi:hypothetical protein